MSLVVGCLRAASVVLQQDNIAGLGCELQIACVTDIRCMGEWVSVALFWRNIKLAALGRILVNPYVMQETAGVVCLTEYVVSIMYSCFARPFDDWSLVRAFSCFLLSFAELNGGLTPVFADQVCMSPLERRVMHLDGSFLVFCCVVGCLHLLTATEVQCCMHHNAWLALPR
jgi:hypothetical protein